MKILYCMTSLSHKRVFESFGPREDVEQLVVGPKPNITIPELYTAGDLVCEGYDRFNLKNIKYFNDFFHLQRIVDKTNPDIFVQASIFPTPKTNPDCKRVYVSQGLVGNHVVDLSKNNKQLNLKPWRGWDLYCGGSDIFRGWIKYAAGSNKVLLNAIPQFDLLFNSVYYKSDRERILGYLASKGKVVNPQKVILFVGFCCKDRADFIYHNEDYFKSVIALEEMAKRRNWLVMVKPRHSYLKMKQFLKTARWGSKYIKKYAEIQKSKYLHFITTTSHIYKYFFADAFVMNGTSTFEVEACICKKPLFIVQTDCRGTKDPYGVKKYRAGVGIVGVNELEHCLAGQEKYHWPENQEKLVQSMGLMIDGKMYERIQEYLIRNGMGRQARKVANG